MEKSPFTPEQNELADKVLSLAASEWKPEDTGTEYNRCSCGGTYTKPCYHMRARMHRILTAKLIRFMATVD
jgi:hypothetical protein